jgi:2-polyprenyl-3-methyl-5-hydroxy-6-metoxy-1,4-benzoquinol methylase
MAATKRTERSWEYYGKNDPYYGVLTQERYSRERWSDGAKQEFFATGEQYIASVSEMVHRWFGESLQPTRALDFGCGVGRLALALARRSGSVVGVDISESMLAVAARNASERGLGNVTFVQGDDTLSRVSGQFDFIHSFIVFQHIPQKRGTAIFEKLVELLQREGVGVLHVTYSYSRSASIGRRIVKAARQYIPFVAGIFNLRKGKPFGLPQMEMNEYDLNRLLQILQDSGCHDVHLRFSETSLHRHPFYGVSFYFRKRSADVGEYG